jgi:hypothetical protein
MSRHSGLNRHEASQSFLADAASKRPRHASHRDEGGVMVIERPARRMTLRQLLIHAEKCSRDLFEQINGTLMPRIGDFRDLTRPVRRKSHYPTLIALMNSLNKLEQASTEIQNLVEYLSEQLEEIHEHARRERVNRS